MPARHGDGMQLVHPVGRILVIQHGAVGRPHRLARGAIGRDALFLLARDRSDVQLTAPRLVGQVRHPSPVGMILDLGSNADGLRHVRHDGYLAGNTKTWSKLAP